MVSNAAGQLSKGIAESTLLDLVTWRSVRTRHAFGEVVWTKDGLE